VTFSGCIVEFPENYMPVRFQLADTLDGLACDGPVSTKPVITHESDHGKRRAVWRFRRQRCREGLKSQRRPPPMAPHRAHEFSRSSLRKNFAALGGLRGGGKAMIFAAARADQDERHTIAGQEASMPQSGKKNHNRIDRRQAGW